MTGLNHIEEIALNMLKECDKVGLPKAYGSDLSIDIDIINKTNKDYVWILRENGTELYKLNSGDNPSNAIYHFKDEKSRIYFITENGNKIVETTREKALDALNEPPFKLTSIKCVEKLIFEVNNLLLSKCWTLWGDEIAKIEKDNCLHWNKFLDYFSNDDVNLVMVDFMRKAIRLKNHLATKSI